LILAVGATTPRADRNRESHSFFFSSSPLFVFFLVGFGREAFFAPRFFSPHLPPLLDFRCPGWLALPLALPNLSLLFSPVAHVPHSDPGPRSEMFTCPNFPKRFPTR